jgi:hypothetical protein
MSHRKPISGRESIGKMLELEASQYPTPTIVVFGRSAVNKNQRAL